MIVYVPFIETLRLIIFINHEIRENGYSSPIIYDRAPKLMPKAAMPNNYILTTQISTF